MKPTREMGERWRLTMISLGTLARTLQNIHPALLQGMVVTAFQTALLRNVTIGNLTCIAHITPKVSGEIVPQFGNPHESIATEGAYRLKVIEAEGTGILAIDRFDGSAWQQTASRSLSEFTSIRIVDRREEFFYGIPTFDLVLLP